MIQFSYNPHPDIKIHEPHLVLVGLNVQTLRSRSAGATSGVLDEGGLSLEFLEHFDASILPLHATSCYYY